MQQLAGPCWMWVWTTNTEPKIPRNSQGIPKEFMIPIAWGIRLCGGLPAVSTGWNCLEGPARFQVEVSTLWKVCPRKNHLLATFVQTKPGANGGHLKLGDPLGWVSSNAKDVFAEAWQQDNHLLQGFWCVTSKISKHPYVKATPLLALRKHPYPNSQVQSSSPSIKFIATQLK
jgi:hypothetical protein